MSKQISDATEDSVLLLNYAIACIEDGALHSAESYIHDALNKITLLKKEQPMKIF